MACRDGLLPDASRWASPFQAPRSLLSKRFAVKVRILGLFLRCTLGCVREMLPGRKAERSQRGSTQSGSCFLLLRGLTTLLFTPSSAALNDLEFHKCGPAFAHGVPCTWKAYLASSPFCSADSRGLRRRHRLTFSRKIFVCRPLYIPSPESPWLPQQPVRTRVMGLWHCVYSMSVYWSFFVGPSGFQTRLQKSHMRPPTEDLLNPRSEARECAFLVSLIRRHSQFGELLPCLCFPAYY